MTFLMMMVWLCLRLTADVFWVLLFFLDMLERFGFCLIDEFDEI